MSRPSSSTSPVARAPSIRSFIRFRQRRNVDLPQPDGPISAITDRSGISSEMSNRACLSPYQNDRLRTWNLAFTPGSLDGLRPLSVRSEMMAEYDSVDIEAPRVRPRTDRAQASDHGGILSSHCIECVKIPGRLGDPVSRPLKEGRR